MANSKIKSLKRAIQHRKFIVQYLELKGDNAPSKNHKGVVFTSLAAITWRIPYGSRDNYRKAANLSRLAAHNKGGRLHYVAFSSKLKPTDPRKEADKMRQALIIQDLSSKS